MAGMFSSPSKPKRSPVPAIPEVDMEGVKKKKRRGGRGKTIITGELEPFLTSKKTLLG